MFPDSQGIDPSTSSFQLQPSPPKNIRSTTNFGLKHIFFCWILHHFARSLIYPLYIRLSVDLYHNHKSILATAVMLFYPKPVLAFGYCRRLRLSVCPSVRVCVNHLLVREITRDPFKVGSPNLDQMCKRPWLRSLLFLGQLTLIFVVKFNLKSLFTPFWVFPHHNIIALLFSVAIEFDF